jgi:WD40 repeat protein
LLSCSAYLRSQATFAGLPEELECDRRTPIAWHESSAGLLAAVSTRREGVQLWVRHAQRWTLLSRLPLLEEQPAPARLFAWTPESAVPEALAVASGSVVTLFRLESGGAAVLSVLKHADRVSSVAWSPILGRVATVAGGSVRIWSRSLTSPEYSCLAEFRPPP